MDPITITFTRRGGRPITLSIALLLDGTFRLASAEMPAVFSKHPSLEGALVEMIRIVHQEAHVVTS